MFVEGNSGGYCNPITVALIWLAIWAKTSHVPCIGDAIKRGGEVDGSTTLFKVRITSLGTSGKSNQENTFSISPFVVGRTEEFDGLVVFSRKKDVNINSYD